MIGIDEWVSNLADELSMPAPGKKIQRPVNNPSRHRIEMDVENQLAQVLRRFNQLKYVNLAPFGTFPFKLDAYDS